MLMWDMMGESGPRERNGEPFCQSKNLQVQIVFFFANLIKSNSVQFEIYKIYI